MPHYCLRLVGELPAAHGQIQGDKFLLPAIPKYRSNPPTALKAVRRTIAEQARNPVTARDARAVIYSFTGPAPNPLAAASTETISVTASTTPTVQEIHQIALHLLCEEFDTALGQLDG